ncbi:MAG: DNA-processing protein DprA [Actinomycetota bacterium]|nr:DNA-processing protein DprA [Actinomycetota bacterium]MDQ3721006.1 DNA-processing protein DprA [Actinomycetota bacterium]
MSAAIAACSGCLRRSLLIGRLAPRIAGLLAAPPEKRTSNLLGLGCGELIEALVAPDERHSVRRWLEQLDLDAVTDELDETDVEALCRHHEPYPPALAFAADSPPVLWLLGGRQRLADALSAPVVTVVGTRRPSPYGREVAYGLGRDLAAAGVTVVSGLALGIDAAAHRGALEGRGASAIAVMANGPDVPYPRTNTLLWRRLAEDAVVMAELPPGQRPYRWSFPARNRIMAATAELTVVVEAAEPSGSLITARFAGQLGRGVGAVPGRVTSRSAAGANALLRDGAAVVRGAQDVIAELAPDSRAMLGARSEQPGSVDEAPALDPAAKQVLEALESEEGLEAIGRRARLAASEVRGALARLEGAGLVLRDPLGRYLRRAGG